MAYTRQEVRWVWLLVVHSKDCLVKGTVLAKTKPICAEIKINILKPILSNAKKMEKLAFSPVVTVQLTYLRALSGIKAVVDHVMCL